MDTVTAGYLTSDSILRYRLIVMLLRTAVSPLSVLKELESELIPN